MRETKGFQSDDAARREGTLRGNHAPAPRCTTHARVHPLAPIPTFPRASHAEPTPATALLPVVAGDGNDRNETEELDAANDENAEVIAELDDLFAALAAQRRGETLFREEMSKPDEEIDLARAAGYVAMHRRPDESRVTDAIEELDALAADLEATLPPPERRFPLRTLKAISRYMFHTLGFKGNQEEFYDPRNSCLDEVLARRTGIPITLALVYMELARRVGVPMVGVNLPAHFMIRPVVEDMEVLVDCFNDGELKFVEDVEDMLKKFYTVGEADKLTIDRSFFADNSMKPRAFLTRMLTNLKQIYFNNDEFAAALQIVAYQAHCAPDEKVALFNRRDGGICLFLMRRHAEATEELSGFLAECDAKGMWDGDGHPRARAQIEQMIEHAKAQVARESVKRSVEDALGESAGADDARGDDPKARDDR